jgi:hypothetical protein
MEGHCLETHVAAVSRADRGDNRDPAVGAASLGKVIDTENRDQTTIQHLGNTTKRWLSDRRMTSTEKSRKTAFSISFSRS